MLALLICNYNKDIGQLLAEIHTEICAFDLSVEVLIGEDCPDSTFNETNRMNCKKYGFNYIINPYNLGRAKNRNQLASIANKPNLVFIDGDARYVNPKFLTNYSIYSNQSFEIIVGGVSYNFDRPTEKNLILHWTYGRERESQTGNSGNFHSFNFMIKKEIFARLKFSEAFAGYGYEDTEFASRAMLDGFSLKYIDNPLFHYGLNRADIFIQNQINAIANLYYWAESSKIPLENKIVKINNNLKKLKLNRIVAVGIKSLQILLEKQLKSKTPILFFLDLLKLKTYIELDCKNQFTV